MYKKTELTEDLYKSFVDVISETNGINLMETLELLSQSPRIPEGPLSRSITEFKKLLFSFQQDELDISTLLGHPVSDALFLFFKRFPIPYYEEHTHLTGSLSADFLYPHIQKILKGPKKKAFEKKVQEAYGEEDIDLTTEAGIDNLLRLREGEFFDTYLKRLYLPKTILTDREIHVKAGYHMAKVMYEKYNVGHIRLKFTLSRATSMQGEELLPNKMRAEDSVMGLYEGMMKYRKENPKFDFILSPSFRKEPDFYDNKKFKSKQEDFLSQVNTLLKILEDHPELESRLCEVDTVGDETGLYRKKHFDEMQKGLRKLQYKGMRVRSHHGETWKTLRWGVQAVDNAMNIWRIDTLEHGLSIGLNPNYYFHSLYQRVLKKNVQGQAVSKNSAEGHELRDMRFKDPKVLDKIFEGKILKPDEVKVFIKAKFHQARELEHYQHDVLNRMIQKKVSLVALPSSNLKLTGTFPDYKDHPFSWWEKKGVNLGIGTDNYITLNTNFIQEMLILLFSDASSLKIMKLLMIATKESRRPYLSGLLWSMRKD